MRREDAAMMQNAENKIPIVIGVSGHRRLRPQDLPALRAAVRERLVSLQAQNPHSPLIMLCSLAEGADLLCADAAEELGIPLIAALPLLLLAWLLQRYAGRSDCLRRYIEYRVLAESLRVSIYLRYAGSGIRAENLLSWTQQEETAWVLDALSALCAGCPCRGSCRIMARWSAFLHGCPKGFWKKGRPTRC